MHDAQTAQAGYARYELEIAIKADRKAVWRAIIEDTNGWWLADFRVVGPASTMQFDVRLGGSGLVEHQDHGEYLQWYVVQSYLPGQFKMHLVGHLAADWGGPSTSNFCLSLEEHPDGCLLKVTDALHGRVDQGSVDSLKSGWQQLFGNGLRRHVEGL